MTIGVWTVAPFHNSMGDIATHDATLRSLCLSGLMADTVVDDPENYDHLVIGGGEILGGVRPRSIRRRLKSKNSFYGVKKAFERPGPHVLNAVGVSPRGLESIDWSFAADYRLVTVRDDETAFHVLRQGRAVHSVPCPATLIRTFDWTRLRSVPRFDELARLEAREFVAVHRHPDLAGISQSIQRRGWPVVTIDAQAHRQHSWHGRGIPAPGSHSPHVGASVVKHAFALLTRSLHLAIFALGSGVPLVALDSGDAQGEKVRRYLRRAGCEHAVVTAQAEAVQRVISGESPSVECRSREIALAQEHLASIASVLRG